MNDPTLTEMLSVLTCKPRIEERGGWWMVYTAPDHVALPYPAITWADAILKVYDWYRAKLEIQLKARRRIGVGF